MTDTTVPVAMLFATLGLMLGFVPRRTAVIATAASLVVVVGVTVLSVPDVSAAVGFPMIWLMIAVLSVFVYWPRFQSPALTFTLAILAGMVGGVAIAPQSFSPLLAIFVVVPATVAVVRGYAIAPRVIMAWLLAVTMLGAILPHVVAHPGYVADHRG